MSQHESEGLRRGLKNALHAAKSMQKELSQIHSGDSKIKVTVTGTLGTEGGTGTSECTFVIIGKTLEAAYEHAKDLTAQGCNCTSSGETEFTCVCKD
jgi:hypothetical protein